MQAKHVYAIAKQTLVMIGGVETRRYWFPGKDLLVKLPHRYDEILCAGLFQVPGVLNPVRAFQCHPSHDVIARDRSGNLMQYEPPDLAALFAKCMT